MNARCPFCGCDAAPRDATWWAMAAAAVLLGGGIEGASWWGARCNARDVARAQAHVAGCPGYKATLARFQPARGRKAPRLVVLPGGRTENDSGPALG